jgi:tRNA threonylcarbamoyl adenosine modification protein YeaZ
VVWLTIDTSWGFNLGLVESAAPKKKVAEAKAASVLGFISNSDSRQHVEQLSPSLERLLKDADLSFADLTAIAVNIGPSPYTGLRVGITAAKTMHLTLGIPVFGVSSLQVETELAKKQFTQVIADRPISENRVDSGLVFLNSVSGIDILVIEDSRRRQVYYSFNASSPQIDFPESVCQLVKNHRQSSNSGPPLVIAGNALAQYQSVFEPLSPDYIWPSNLDQPASALEYVRVAKMTDYRDLTPLYLRRPDVSPRRNPASARNRPVTDSQLHRNRPASAPAEPN